MSALQTTTFEINQSSLQSLLPKAAFGEQLPLKFTVKSDRFEIATSALGNTGDQDIIELVVLGDINVEQLHQLANTLFLQDITLTTINQRLNQFSYRFTVHCGDVSKAREDLASYALGANIEAALVVNAPRLNEPGLLVMDMDSTTIEIECIDEIAALAGVGEQVAKVTEQAMQGELDFAQSLIQRVATLKNAPESILAEVARNIPLMKGLKTLIAELKQHKWRIAIASGGFTYFADHLKASLALDDAKANVLAIENGMLTGEVIGSIVDAQAKADTLAELGLKYGISPSQFVAMGDGANDLLMMNAAQLGVAFHAKPIVLKQADCAINVNGLDYLLHWLR
ncbi:phosphoserine phosphatase SerB [Thalassotalea ganghwensis]